jgi:hypothetical protein
MKMNFLTRDQIKTEAGKGEIEALKCSLKHHEQGRDATSLELQNAIRDDRFGHGPDWCSSCVRDDEVESDCSCGLYGKQTGCCNGLYNPVYKALGIFTKDPSNANHKAFTEAESKVCEYIQGVIDKKEAELEDAKKPVLKVGDIWGDGSPVMLLNEWNIHHRNNEKGRIVDCQCDLMPNFSETYYKGQPIIGNLKDIFDDLKAMQENVTEFEMDCLSHAGDRVSMSIVDSESRPVFELKYYKKGVYAGNCFVKITDFILKLRQMQATLKRNEAKK